MDTDIYEPKEGPRPSMTDIVPIYVNFEAKQDAAKPGVKTYPYVPLKATNWKQLTAAFETQKPKASLSIKGHHPAGPTQNELLEKVNFNLQQVQFNQLRGSNP